MHHTLELVESDGRNTEEYIGQREDVQERLPYDDLFSLAVEPSYTSPSESSDSDSECAVPLYDPLIEVGSTFGPGPTYVPAMQIGSDEEEGEEEEEVEHMTVEPIP